MVDFKNIYSEVNHVIIGISQISSAIAPKFFNACSEVLRFVRLFTDTEIMNVATADYFTQKFPSIPAKKLKAIFKKYEEEKHPGLPIVSEKHVKKLAKMFVF